MKKENSPWKWVLVIIFLIILAFTSLFVAAIVAVFVGLSSEEASATGNVALIPISGTIVTEKEDFLFERDIVSADEIIKLIDKADKDPSIQAIMFEINSPGGSAVASDEIASRIKKLQKPTVSYIREVGASGAYWIASSSNYIIANRMSITGSIGVIASYLEFSGLLEQYNITYQRLVSGKYKDIGTPFKKLTREEEILLQNILEDIKQNFIDAVAENRKLSKEKVEDMATGLFYLGSQAKDLGLVDELGGKEEAILYLQEKLNTTIEVAEYKKSKSFFELLSEALNEQSFYVGEGIGSSLIEKSRVETLKVLT